MDQVQEHSLEAHGWFGLIFLILLFSYSILYVFYSNFYFLWVYYL